MFLAMEGATGVGKTTLATGIARLMPDYELYLDPFAENSEFFADDSRPMLTEMTFLALRVSQLKQIQNSLARGESVVTDWTLLKCPAFASLELNANDVAPFRRSTLVWWEFLPQPTTTLFLKAPPSVVVERVQRRGRAYESHIDETRVRQESQALESELVAVGHELNLIDTSSIDLREESGVRELCGRLKLS
jgi:deoxyguanosine kinase